MKVFGVFPHVKIYFKPSFINQIHIKQYRESKPSTSQYSETCPEVKFFMKSRKGQFGLRSALMIGVVIVGSLFAVNQFAPGVLSAGAGGNGEPTQVQTKDATLNLAAEQLQSSTKVATTAYATLDDGTVVTKSIASGQFTAWSVFTNKDTVTVRAFDSGNYPITETVSFDGSTQLNEVVKTADIASASDIAYDFVESSGTSDNDGAVNVAAGGQATVKSLEASVEVQDLYYNAGIVMVDKPSGSNVTVKMSNAKAVAVPESAPSAVDAAWKTFSPSKGDDSFKEFATHKSSQIVIKGDDINDPAETLTFYTDDVQAYQSSDTGKIKYGITDGSGNGLGLAEQSVALSVN